MTRAVDVLSVVLLVSGIGAFGAGVHSLGERSDVLALYWLVVGALLLKAATDMLKPKATRR